MPFRTAVVSAMIALVAALAPGVASAAPGDIGVEDFNYAPIGGSPTGPKPESKLWFNDGIWWASMFDPVTANHMIFRLNRQTQQWVKTNTTIDTRDSSRVDMLWDGTKLYAASVGFTNTSSTTATTSQNGRLWRFSYNSTTKTYSLDTANGFTAAGVRINTARSETLVIDKDSTGRLWATWMTGGQVWVAATTGNDTQWGTPFTVGTGATSDDISSLIAFDPGGPAGSPTGPQIGVMWSNQTNNTFRFATHFDSTAAANSGWNAAAIQATGAPQSSDDHINLKTRDDGTVYAAVKHSTSGTAPLNSLFVRTPTGSWSSRTFGTGRDSHTRPIVMLDGGGVHMFATGPQPPATSGQSGGDIVKKSSTSFTNPTFATGVGTAVIRDNGTPDMNDVTSTKQNATAASGIVIMANNATTKNYWHADLGATGTTPTPPVASFSTNPVDTTGNAPFTVSFTDTSTGGAVTSRRWDFGDGTVVTGTSATSTISHTYSAAGQFTAVLTVSNADGSSSASKIIVVNSNAPRLTASFTSTKRADGFTFDFAGTATNGSASTTFSWDFGDGATSTAQNPTHTYTRAGTFNVTLTVTDGANTDTATQQVTAGTTTPGTATFTPAADTQVKDTSPNTNYGTLTTLRVRNGTSASPTTYWTFLRFDVTGVGTVSNAKLRLFVTDDSNDGGTVYRISNSPAWAETTLTWATRPVTTLPAGIKAAGAVPLGWIEIDLGTAVTGDGTYNFVLASASTTSAIYSSREGANPPQLVLTTG
ncbi:MAG TPA: PKD domain-containing protein [Solirubrobacteraceae bacterium]|nr:PKD domain-containing protein [Solirubrobacteraceae bacterium]